MVISIIVSILLAPLVFLTLIPVFPAIPMMFGLGLIYGFVDKFKHLDLNNYLMLGGILAVSILIDYFAGILGAKYGGAAKESLIFGLLGVVLGTFLLPPFGGVLGLFLGILIAEIIRFKDHYKAIKAASYSVVGTITGVIFNFFLAIAFFVLFLIFVF